MAHVSGYSALLMVFMAQGVPALSLLNTNYTTAELLKTAVGSFCLIIAAPLTGIVEGFLYVKGKTSCEKSTGFNNSVPE